MSNSTSTRWYVGAWIVWALSWAIAFMTGQTTVYHFGILVQGSSPAGAVAVLLIGITALVMFVVWIGALIRLGQLRSWGWFVAVLVLHLVGLGIIGILTYALAGPEDALVVRRPTVT